MSKYQLVSFKLCPFVQRSVITLLEKKVDYEITYIDLENKPEWFLDISPRGKVPILKLEDKVLCESAVINEYLDEVNPPSMHPKDSLEKAFHRAYIELSSDFIMNQHKIIIAKDKEQVNESLSKIIGLLEHLEKGLTNGKFFSGDNLSLVDCAFAPFFMRIVEIDKYYSTNMYDKFPKVKQWQENILSLESVKKSVVEDFSELFNKYLKNKGSFIVNA